MPKTSIIIASRNETHPAGPRTTVLQRMIQDLYEKLTGDFEVLIAFDGPPYQSLPDHLNLRHFDLRESIGLKPCINMLAREATGKYLLKFDSHCMVSDGIDEVLQEQMEENWLVMPRFAVLNAEEWKWQDERFYDYFYLRNPHTDPKGFRFQAGGHWKQRTRERSGVGPLDETMTIHGSCWFIDRKFLLNEIGGWSSIGYDTFSHEHAEPACKVWLGPWDGRVLVNKKCWYAHAHKGGQRPRGYPLSMKRIQDSYFWAADHWLRNQWEGQTREFGWLVDRFWPVPTWPEDWRERERRRQEHDAGLHLS